MGLRHFPLNKDTCAILFSWMECHTHSHEKHVEAATAVLNRTVDSPSDWDLVSWVAESLKKVTDRQLEPDEQRIIDDAVSWTPEPSTAGVSTVSKPSAYSPSLVAAMNKLDVTESHVHNPTPPEHERIGAFMASRRDIFAAGDIFPFSNKMPALPSPTEFTRDDLPNDLKSLQLVIKNRLEVERDVGDFLKRNRMILYQLKIKEMLLRKEQGIRSV